MALEGTLKDFALPDILQLIGMQRKTGVLTMESDTDTVTVQFVQGQVVGADTRSRNLEDTLGAVLVRSGKITQVQLQEALAIQKETLQRLGYILVRSGYLSEDELREALRVQVNQIVFRLFRWREGRYHFLPMDHLEYDRSLTIPVPADSLLMEAARMVDEWPILEKKIKSPRMVFRKTAAGDELANRAGSREIAGEVDFALDLLGGEAPASAAPEPSPEEREILRLVDGRNNVQDVADRSSLGEFDVYRQLHDLLQRELIEAAPQERDPDAKRRPDAEAGRSRMLAAAAMLLAVVGLAAAAAFPWAPWRLGDLGKAQDALRWHASRGRLERIERAIEAHFLDTGTFPPGIDALVERGYLAGAAGVDPWGRRYLLERDADGFRLAGRDANGAITAELSQTRRFSASQRLVLEGPAGVPPDAP